MKKTLLASALAALALAGCETIVDVDAPAHTPRLALVYTLSTQAPTADYRQFFDNRTLYVSTSQSVLETKLLQGRADATVELRDASGQVVEQFRAKSRTGYGRDSVRGYYVPVRGYVGQPGRTYTLRASAPGVPPAEATLTLPAPATAGTGRYVPKPRGSNTYYDYAGQFSFSVPDNAATTDYYLAYARVLDARGQYWGRVSQDYSVRNNSGPDIKLQRFDLSDPGSQFQILPLSDAGRQGQPLNFSQDVILYYGGGYNSQNPVIPAPAFIEVIISTIPVDTYNFYQSMQRYYDTDGNPFAEPAPLHSNVTPGYGLFGGATDVTFRIPL